MTETADGEKAEQLSNQLEAHSFGRKLIRGQEHHEKVRLEIAAWVQEDPVEIRQRTTSDDHIFEVRLLKEPPRSLGETIGDAVFNYRACLDQLFFALAEQHQPATTPAERRRRSFPLVSDPDDLTKAAFKKQMKQVDPQVRPIIEGLQPVNYWDPIELDAGSDPLLDLLTLVNGDKHQVTAGRASAMSGTRTTAYGRIKRLETPSPVLSSEWQPVMISSLDNRAALSVELQLTVQFDRESDLADRSVLEILDRIEARLWDGPIAELLHFLPPALR